MTRQRWQRIETLYHAARECEPAERAAFLNHACHGDEELRRKIELLLAQDSTSEKILDHPAIELMVASSGTELKTGALVGPYRIDGILGRGGMGDVFRATDTRLGRPVAIKVAQERFSDRFDREAKLIATLNHPNVCTLYDVGPNYLVMEFIEGEPLKGPLPVEKVFAYASQILDALEAAHVKRIVHRDLKPANILVTKNGIKLLDFGLAKLTPDNPHRDEETQTLSLTGSHAVMGTPGYMAPEQWEGKPADARSDIYSFGCVLYEMLTGKRAGADRISVRPAALEFTVRTCLARDPAERFQSVVDIRPQLKSALPSRRWKYGIAAAGAVLSAAVAGFLIWPRTPAAPLTDKDVVVLADFTSSTKDAVFDDTLREALEISLQESPFLLIMEDEQVRQTLQLMGRPPTDRITNPVAREICVRTGEKAMIGGAIASLDKAYAITLVATDCQSGKTLAREQVEAEDKERSLRAVVTAATALRVKLGESLSSIHVSDPTVQLTTASFDAFQIFSEGFARLRQRSSIEALPFFQRAAAVDPNFAEAYFLQGLMYLNLGQVHRRNEALKRAFSLLDRVSEKERLEISSFYYEFVTGDLDKAIVNAQQEARIYPRWFGPHNSLASICQLTGSLEDALRENQQALRLYGGASFLYGNLIESFANLGRYDEAKAVAEQASARKMDSAELHQKLLIAAYDQGDLAAAQREIQWMSGKPEEFGGMMIEALYASQRGQFREERHLLERAGALMRRSGLAPPPDEQALLGNCGPIRNVARAHPLAPEVSDEAVRSAVPAALCGETSVAQKLADKAAKQRPLDTLLNGLYLPTLNAAIELAHNRPQKAVESLAPAAQYDRGVDGGVLSVYLRGLGYLRAKQGPEAAAEFQRILNHTPFFADGLVYPLSYVGLARAAKLSGDTLRAKKAYQDFFAFWKDADRDSPVLIAAHKEFASLK
jgi:eukaryotic-like serine/threonine-protein kinase